MCDFPPQYEIIVPKEHPKDCPYQTSQEKRTKWPRWRVCAVIIGSVAILTVSILVALHMFGTSDAKSGEAGTTPSKTTLEQSAQLCVPCSSLRQLCTSTGSQAYKEQLLASETIVEGKLTGVCCSGNSEQSDWLRNAIKRDAFAGLPAPMHLGATVRNLRAAHVFLRANNRQSNSSVASDDGTLREWSPDGNCAFVRSEMKFDMTRFRILYSGLYFIYSNVAFQAPLSEFQTLNIVYGQSILRVHRSTFIEVEQENYPDCLLDTFQQVTCTNENTAPCHVSQLSGLVRLQSQDEIFVKVPNSSRRYISAYPQMTYFGLYQVSE